MTDKGEEMEAPMNLKELRKSKKDKMIAGICGGFGENTPVPSWLWRTIFIALIFMGFIGPIAYVILWIFMPAADQPPQA